MGGFSSCPSNLVIDVSVVGNTSLFVGSFALRLTFRKGEDIKDSLALGDRLP